MKAGLGTSLALVLAAACSTTRATSEASTSAADGTPAGLADAASSAPAAQSPAPDATASGTKIAAPIAEAVSKLADDAAKSANGKPNGATLYSTPFVKVDAAGRIHAYVHVTSLGEEERAVLTAAGAKIEVAMERLRIVQAWLPYERVEAIAALPFVLRITPPSYSTPR